MGKSWASYERAGGVTDKGQTTAGGSDDNAATNKSHVVK